uniref:Uncharacterized protein n=1 Tax=Oryza brachyantha TaxID=4533 RepID=J3N1J4_ORYBR
MVKPTAKSPALIAKSVKSPIVGGVAIDASSPDILHPPVLIGSAVRPALSWIIGLQIAGTKLWCLD